MIMESAGLKLLNHPNINNKIGREKCHMILTVILGLIFHQLLISSLPSGIFDLIFPGHIPIFGGLYPHTIHGTPHMAQPAEPHREVLHHRA